MTSSLATPAITHAASFAPSGVDTSASVPSSSTNASGPAPAQQPTFAPLPPQPASPLRPPAVQPHHLLSLAATPSATTPIHSPSWPALPPSFGLEAFGRDHAPSAEWASLSSFIDSLDFPPDLFTPDVRSPAAGGIDDSGGDREAYAAFIEQLRLKQTQLAASRPGSPRTQAFTQASSSFLQLPVPQMPSSPAAPNVALAAGVVPSKREFMELLQAQFEGAQLAPNGKLWDWERGWKAVDDWLATCVPPSPPGPTDGLLAVIDIRLLAHAQMLGEEQGARLCAAPHLSADSTRDHSRHESGRHHARRGGFPTAHAAVRPSLHR